MIRIKHIIILIASFFLPEMANARLPKSMTNYLEKKGLLTISKKTCQQIEGKIGQLFFMRADAHGTKDSQVIHPIYEQLIKQTKPGGILFRVNRSHQRPLDVQLKAIKSWHEMNKELPLFIGGDVCKFKHKNKLILSFAKVKLNSEQNECSILVDAALTKISGCNTILGPIIEKKDESDEIEMYKANSKMTTKIFSSVGITTSVKHFPYTQPNKFDPHKTTLDIKISKEKLKKDFFSYFENVLPFSGMVMTTHMLNSNIDPLNNVSFSKKWISLLRDESNLNYDGIIISDAVEMIDNFPPEIKYHGMKWNERLDLNINPISITTLRTILSGHDMILSQTSSDQYETRYRDLMKLACQDDSLGKKLRLRINESYDRIKRYKEKNKEALSNITKVSNADISYLVGAANSKSCDIERVKNIVSKMPSVKTIDFNNNCYEQQFDIIDKELINKFLIDTKEIKDNLPVHDYIEALLSSNNEVVVDVLDYIKVNEDKRSKILKKVQKMYGSNDPVRKMNALALFAIIGKFPPELIKNIFKNNEKSSIDTIIKLSLKYKIPRPNLNTTEVIKLFEGYQNDLNNAKGWRNKNKIYKQITDYLRLIFPSEYLKNSGINEFNSLPIDPRIKADHLGVTGNISRMTLENLMNFVKVIDHDESISIITPFGYINYDSMSFWGTTMIERLSQFSDIDKSKLERKIGKIKSTNRIDSYVLKSCNFLIKPSKKSRKHFINSLKKILPFDYPLQLDFGIYTNGSFTYLRTSLNSLLLSNAKDYLNNKDKKLIIKILKKIKEEIIIYKKSTARDKILSEISDMKSKYQKIIDKQTRYRPQMK